MHIYPIDPSWFRPILTLPWAFGGHSRGRKEYAGQRESDLWPEEFLLYKLDLFNGSEVD